MRPWVVFMRREGKLLHINAYCRNYSDNLCVDLQHLAEVSAFELRPSHIVICTFKLKFINRKIYIARKKRRASARQSAQDFHRLKLSTQIRAHHTLLAATSATASRTTTRCLPAAISYFTFSISWLISPDTQT